MRAAHVHMGSAGRSTATRDHGIGASIDAQMRDPAEAPVVKRPQEGRPDGGIPHGLRREREMSEASALVRCRYRHQSSHLEAALDGTSGHQAAERIPDDVDESTPRDRMHLGRHRIE